jgi:hypothetical protein
MFEILIFYIKNQNNNLYKYKIYIVRKIYKQFIWI